MPDASRWGIEPGYWSVEGQWHTASDAAVAAALAAMGASDGAPPDAAAALPAWVDRSARCPLPARGWGWAVQLYELHSASGPLIGDLGAVRDLGRWSRARGASFLLLSPLHAPVGGVPQEPSPYFASSRLFRNPLYARVDDGHHDAEQPPDQEEVVAPRAHDRAVTIKSSALDAAWRADTTDHATEVFIAELEAEGLPLLLWGTFCTLSEVHDGPWWDWPADVRHPTAPGVARAAEELADRVRFHCWVQRLLDAQLAAAAAEIPLVVDLAIGTDPAGFDGWRWQDLMARGFRVGAPPDDFNADGQDWGLPPFDPWGLVVAGFAPFVELVRASLRHAAGLRIDHVMGLSRLYWVPPDMTGRDGVYVRYPVDELLAILATEARRAGAFVVGEDLGTVEDRFREQLADRSVLSTRLLWFEPSTPDQWREDAMASITTHDLPTVAGVWTGCDGTDEMRERLRAVIGGDADGLSDAEVAARAYATLAASPSLLVAATLEDALGVPWRPNVPGGEDPLSWRRRLPVAVEELVGDGSPLAAVAQALRR